MRVVQTVPPLSPVYERVRQLSGKDIPALFKNAQNDTHKRTKQNLETRDGEEVEGSSPLLLPTQEAGTVERTDVNADSGGMRGMWGKSFAVSLKLLTFLHLCAPGREVGVSIIRSSDVFSHV